MFEAAMMSAKAFFTGKLFQDTPKVMRQLAVGVISGVVVIVIAGLVLPVWLAAILGGAVAGAMQPVLFKDLKYV